MPRSASVVLDGLGFSLSRAAKKFRDEISPTLDELGLYIGQELFLAQLWLEDGLLQTEMAHRLQVDHASVSKSAKRLVAVGFIETRTDDDDRRTSRIFLTQSGAALQAPVERAWAEAEANVLKAIGKKKTSLLKSLLIELSRPGHQK